MTTRSSFNINLYRHKDCLRTGRLRNGPRLAGGGGRGGCAHVGDVQPARPERRAAHQTVKHFVVFRRGNMKIKTAYLCVATTSLLIGAGRAAEPVKAENEHPPKLVGLLHNEDCTDIFYNGVLAAGKPLVPPPTTITSYFPQTGIAKSPCDTVPGSVLR